MILKCIVQKKTWHHYNPKDPPFDMKHQLMSVDPLPVIKIHLKLTSCFSSVFLIFFIDYDFCKERLKKKMVKTMISNQKYLYFPHTRSLNPVFGLKSEKNLPFQFCLFFYSSTKNAKKSPQVAPKALKMLLISQKPLDIWFLSKNQWKKYFW